MVEILRDLGVVAGGFVTGFFSGVMGLGGGTIMIPILVLGFGLAQRVAQGTSLAAIIPISLVGALTHHRQGNVDLHVAGWMALGGAAGAVLGALLAFRVAPGDLVRIFGAFLIISALRIWPIWPRRRRDGEKSSDPA